MFGTERKVTMGTVKGPVSPLDYPALWTNKSQEEEKNTRFERERNMPPLTLQSIIEHTNSVYNCYPTNKRSLYLEGALA